MNIIVLIKQVPDMDNVKFDCDSGMIDRKSAGTEVNPFDYNALEVAVQIKEQQGGQITALSMGPSSAETALREAISRGADRGVLVSDKFFGGADVKATARTLSAAIQLLGGADLIVTGIQTVDGDTGQVGPEVAGYLGWDHIYSVIRVRQASDQKITVETDLWDSIYVKQASYPVLISVTKEVNSPRMASFSGKVKAKKAPIQTVQLADLSSYLAADEVGMKGSPTYVKKIVIPPSHVRDGKILEGVPTDIANQLKNILMQHKLWEGADGNV